jgi:hypothetical protein
MYLGLTLFAVWHDSSMLYSSFSTAVPMNNLLCTLGRRKLFTDEEKALLSKRLPDLEAAASVSGLCSEYFSRCQIICNVSHKPSIILGTEKCPDILSLLTY